MIIAACLIFIIIIIIIVSIIIIIVIILIIVGCRSRQRGEAAVKEIINTSGNSKVFGQRCPMYKNFKHQAFDQRHTHVY